MKKRLVAVLSAVACMSVGAVAGGFVAHAQTAPTPEIDRANATIQLNGTLRSVSCVGEDAIPYVTFTGTWKGTETQILPDPTDYPLSGSLTVSTLVWTINSKTGRGVLTGKITLVSSTAASLVYSGKLTLVTQGTPAAGASVPGRGWISAAMKLPDETVTPGDDNLIANVEFAIGVGGATGQFGDAPGSLGIPDYSVVTNVAPTAPDGVC